MEVEDVMEDKDGGDRWRSWRREVEVKVGLLEELTFSG